MQLKIKIYMQSVKSQITYTDKLEHAFGVIFTEILHMFWLETREHELVVNN